MGRKKTEGGGKVNLPTDFLIGKDVIYATTCSFMIKHDFISCVLMSFTRPTPSVWTFP